MSSLVATNASFIIGFIIFESIQYGNGRNISISHFYSANHSALDSWTIREGLASQNDDRHVLERRGIEEQQ